jgi:hypothetical protein
MSNYKDVASQIGKATRRKFSAEDIYIPSSNILVSDFKKHLSGRWDSGT